MPANSKLYDKIVLTNAKTRNQLVSGSKTYRGFSTVAAQTNSVALYDIELIKQDLLNHFHIRLGERLEQPEFGTIIWDVLFDPLTEELKMAIVKNVQTIVSYDPRIRAEQVIVTSYESGIQIQCSLVYYPYNVSEALQLRFDKENGLLLN